VSFSDSSAIIVAASALAANNINVNESSYLITVFVTNDVSTTASTTKTITVIGEVIPQVSIGIVHIH
jgi:hypothetical protein